MNNFSIRVTLDFQDHRVVEDLKDKGYTYIPQYYMYIVPK